ncbi:hypothetical protein H257_17740 [Aphanomyces astaci]|uniref:Uncharacterized protein n=1 Tax=Aphanomyces astaci TaxID=112090 RepID=W4FDN3_APHAT|nr:hypothetical protein H257_17740 [Aphanomyces astaci]ETV65587.1 hypothetical protein H257_17740 [Aphanomyces astaci]|eukprot:XP_009844929.1 hypothetical protein H257_17740 [Aphanomyces astaci]
MTVSFAVMARRSSAILDDAAAAYHPTDDDATAILSRAVDPSGQFGWTQTLEELYVYVPVRPRIVRKGVNVLATQSTDHWTRSPVCMRSWRPLCSAHCWTGRSRRRRSRVRSTHALCSRRPLARPWKCASPWSSKRPRVGALCSRSTWFQHSTHHVHLALVLLVKAILVNENRSSLEYYPT